MKVSDAEIRQCIIDALNVEKEKIIYLGECELLESVDIDSVQFISLIIYLEEKFNIEFEDDDLIFSKINSINKIIEVMKKY